MSNLPNVDGVEAINPGGEPERQCQVILPHNRLQCLNKAYAKLDNADVCRVHLNAFVGAENFGGQVAKALNPEDQADVDNILKTSKSKD